VEDYDSVAYSPGRQAKLSRAELAEYQTEIEKMEQQNELCSDATKADQQPAIGQVPRALKLVLTDGFQAVAAD